MKVEIEIKTFGDMVFFKMHDEQLGVREVAKVVGISPIAISRISAGHSMQMKHIIPIAKWLGINPEQLWDFLEMYE